MEQREPCICAVIHFVVERFTPLQVNERCSDVKDKGLSKLKAYVEV